MSGAHAHSHEHGHSHGLVDASVKRSRSGGCPLAARPRARRRGAAGDLPRQRQRRPARRPDPQLRRRQHRDPAWRGLPAALRRAERWAELFVVAAIFISACVAGVASALVVALGLPIADPLIGLGITAVILKITRDSWHTVRGHTHHRH